MKILEKLGLDMDQPGAGLRWATICVCILVLGIVAASAPI